MRVILLIAVVFQPQMVKFPITSVITFLQVKTSYLIAGLVLVSLGCSGSSPKSTEVEPASTYFPIQLDGKVVYMQLALTSEEIQRGLMFRKEMGEHDGMLFVFDNPGPRSFYMRNTKIPLDVAYFTRDGVLREIYPMYPLDETAVPSRRQDVQLVLEMNQGWFRENGVRPGARIDLEAVTLALQARGMPPTRYQFAMEENRTGERVASAD